MFSPRAFRSDRSNYVPASTEPQRPKRSRYEEERRKEVEIVRNIGACHRCRLLKTGCSGKRPCDACLKKQLVYANRVKYRWMDCVPFTLKGLDIFLPGSEWNGKEYVSKLGPFFEKFKNAHFAFAKPWKHDLNSIASHFLERVAGRKYTQVTEFSGYQILPALEFERFVSPLMGQHFGLNLFLLSVAGSACELSEAYRDRVGMTLEEWESIRSSAGSEVLRGLERALSKTSLTEASLEDLHVLILSVYWTIQQLWYWSPLKNSHSRQQMARQDELLRVLSHHLIILAERVLSFSVDEQAYVPTEINDSDRDIFQELHIEWAVYVLRIAKSIPCMWSTLSVPDAKLEQDRLTQITLDPMEWQTDSPAHLVWNKRGNRAGLLSGKWFDLKLRRTPVVVTGIQYLTTGSSLWETLQESPGKFTSSQAAVGAGWEDPHNRGLFPAVPNQEMAYIPTASTSILASHLGEVSHPIYAANEPLDLPGMPPPDLNNFGYHSQPKQISTNISSIQHSTYADSFDLGDGSFNIDDGTEDESGGLSMLSLSDGRLQCQNAQEYSCVHCRRPLNASGACHICAPDFFGFWDTGDQALQYHFSGAASAPTHWPIFGPSQRLTCINTFQLCGRP